MNQIRPVRFCLRPFCRAGENLRQQLGIVPAANSRAPLARDHAALGYAVCDDQHRAGAEACCLLANGECRRCQQCRICARKEHHSNGLHGISPSVDAMAATLKESDRTTAWHKVKKALPACKQKIAERSGEFPLALQAVMP